MRSYVFQDGLSKDTENDLIRIHHYGVIKYGEAQADKYYFAFFDCFEKIAEQPYLYQAVDHIREGYRHSICGADTIYYRIEGNNIRPRHLPPHIPHNLIFTYLHGESDDGTISIESQLRAEAQEDAAHLYGFLQSHNGILEDLKTSKLINQLLFDADNE